MAQGLAVIAHTRGPRWPRAVVVFLVGGALATLVACGARPAVRGAGSESSAARIAEPAGEPQDASAPSCEHDTKQLAACTTDCDQGLAPACAMVALRLERGDGVTRDLTRAVGLYERACVLRDASSCVVAARKHAIGAGVPPDRARQMDLLARGCILGEASACAAPAKAFSAGAGVTANPQRARELWEHACTGGLETACEVLMDAGS